MGGAYAMKHLILFSLLVVIIGVGFSTAHAVEITRIFVFEGFAQVFFDLTSDPGVDNPTATYLVGSRGFTIDLDVFRFPAIPDLNPGELDIRVTNSFGTRPGTLVTDAMVEFRCGPFNPIEGGCPFLGLRGTPDESDFFGPPTTIRLDLSPFGAGSVAWGVAALPETGSTRSFLALSLLVLGLFAGANARLKQEVTVKHPTFASVHSSALST
jgi:hypothetical protein